MKNTLFIAAATLIYSAAQAQGTNATMGNQGTTGSTAVTDTTKKLNAYGSYSTRDSIAAKYKLLPMPVPLTTEKAFPVLGSYQLNSNTNATTASGTASSTNTETAGTTAMDETALPMVSITMDSVSRGMVWIEGLPQGTMKAYLRKSPSTYRIIAQKTQSGTSVPEGTMFLDTETNVLNIVLGAPYNEADPTSIFGINQGTEVEDIAVAPKTTTKTSKKAKNAKNATAKAKPKFYTATKIDPAAQLQNPAATSDNFNQGLQKASDNGQQ
jgi:hypothetical protein